jgi:hypothetical protein
VFTGNVIRHNRYGVKGPRTTPGLDTLRTYFPGAVFTGNTIAGGKEADYPGNRIVAVEAFGALFDASAKR